MLRASNSRVLELVRSKSPVRDSPGWIPSPTRSTVARLTEGPRMAIDKKLVASALERIETDISQALETLSRKPAVHLVKLSDLLEKCTLRNFLRAEQERHG